MRFSLRTLLLMFPLLIVVYGLAYFLGNIIFWQTRNHAPWEKEKLPIHRLHEFANTYGPLADYSKSEMFQLLAGLLSKGNPGSFQSLLIPTETSDCWGNPYRCVCLDERHSRTESDQVALIGIYSVGEDGISLTEGNDPDDLNSWKFDLSYYILRDAERVMWERRIKSLWLMPVVALVLVILWGVGSFVWLLLRRPESFEWERTLNRR